MAELYQSPQCTQGFSDHLPATFLGVWLSTPKASYNMVQWSHSGSSCGERTVRGLPGVLHSLHCEGHAGFGY